MEMPDWALAFAYFLKETFRAFCQTICSTSELFLAYWVFASDIGKGIGLIKKFPKTCLGLKYRDNIQDIWGLHGDHKLGMHAYIHGFNT